MTEEQLTIIGLDPSTLSREWLEIQAEVIRQAAEAMINENMTTGGLTVAHQVAADIVKGDEDGGLMTTVPELTHAKLSGSSASRWMNCPTSVRRQDPGLDPFAS